MQQLEDTQLQRFDDYLEYNKNKFNLYRTNQAYKIKNILVGAINNLVYTQEGAAVTIKIEPNQVVPGMKLTFDEIARLVNYGNSSVAAYNIFDNVFSYFAANIESYYTLFIARGE